ncbi:MAG TPA: transaldolase, partial [Gammaproteobacteria bacterium]|nr:transaldolase [Gammaproteobacteria bacterium]
MTGTGTGKSGREDSRQGRLVAEDGRVGAMAFSLPASLQADVDAVLADWQADARVERLWARDASLWTGSDEDRWLDWLTVVSEQLDQVDDLQRELQFVRGEGFRHAVLLGMGGSSLAPDVLRHTFGVVEGYPDWHILDSTDPAQIRVVEQAIDYDTTLFLVSSKSGSTLEPNILKDYFFSRTGEQVEGRHPGNQFMAVTDPGSALERRAEDDYFRKIFHGKPEIGGRFSALSNFGMVPAVAMGLNAERLLERASFMVDACGAAVAPARNPGVVLGAILAAAAGRGRDKLTLVASPAIATLGAWLEQLVAESTGKQGKGIIPVDGERLAAPEAYGDDRLFVYLRLGADADAAQDEAVA